LLEELKNININELDEFDAKNLEEKIQLTQMLLVKYEEQFDNTTLIKPQIT
jgi:hypothetical protein